MMLTKNNLDRILLFSILLTALACSKAGGKYFGAYGEPISTNDVTSLSEIDFSTIGAQGEPITLSGTIETTCKVKGCWMKMDNGQGGSMRVTFKDYGFFVPKEGVEGKTAVIQGVMDKKEVSVEELRHYALDAGKSQDEIAAITEPTIEYSFIAEGVVIK